MAKILRPARCTYSTVVPTSSGFMCRQRQPDWRRISTLSGPKGDVEYAAASSPYSPPSVPINRMMAGDNQHMLNESEPEINSSIALSVVSWPKISGVMLVYRPGTEPQILSFPAQNKRSLKKATARGHSVVLLHAPSCHSVLTLVQS